jgi:endonuclease III
MKDVILKQKVSLHLHLDEALREITDLLLETSRGTMSDDMGLLNSITGIGDKTAAGFLIEMGGDIQ